MAEQRQKSDKIQFDTDKLPNEGISKNTIQKLISRLINMSVLHT